MALVVRPGGRADGHRAHPAAAAEVAALVGAEELHAGDAEGGIELGDVVAGLDVLALDDQAAQDQRIVVRTVLPRSRLAGGCGGSRRPHRDGGTPRARRRLAGGRRISARAVDLTDAVED